MHATNSRDLQEWQQVFEEYKEKGVEYTQWVSNKKLHRPYFKK